MYKHVFKNIANLTILLRVLLVFVVVALLGGSASQRLLSLPLLLVALLLDGLDGYLARKLRIASAIGGLLDTLGDRITENVLIFYFAFVHIVPQWFALFFLVRSFLADFIRGLNFNKGFTTFAINRSVLGKILVSSEPSRIVYLLSKFSLFILGGFIIAHGAHAASLRTAIQCLYWFVFIFSFARFILLMQDSKVILKEHFHAGND